MLEEDARRPRPPARAIDGLGRHWNLVIVISVSKLFGIIDDVLSREIALLACIVVEVELLVEPGCVPVVFPARLELLPGIPQAVDV